MIHPIVAFIFAVGAALPVSFSAHAEERNVDHKLDATNLVSVRLRPLKGMISVVGAGMRIGVTATNPIGVIASKGFDRLQFRPIVEASNLKWEVLDGTSGERLTVVSSRILEIAADEGVRIDLRPGPPRFRLVAKKRGGIIQQDLVGVLPLEEYLVGVVSSEVPRDWPEEALKAQAVAARSFAVAKLRERERLKPDWLLESTVMDQVFDHERSHDRARKAVAATSGEVLTAAATGSVTAAHYHSDCGGATEEPAVVWGGGPLTGTAKDTSCPLRPGTKWRLVMSLDEISKKLSAEAVVPEKFHLASMIVLRRSQSGRASMLRLRGEDGRKFNLSGEKLRAALGYSNLRSTLFDVSIPEGVDAVIATNRRVEFAGRGFGHGSGLCQWGARSMASSGKTYREILGHYYPRLKPVVL